jgi:hypothetical protein
LLISALLKVSRVIYQYFSTIGESRPLQDVFHMSHDKAKAIIRDGGNKLTFVLERYIMTHCGLFA